MSIDRKPTVRFLREWEINEFYITEHSRVNKYVDLVVFQVYEPSGIEAKIMVFSEPFEPDFEENYKLKDVLNSGDVLKVEIHEVIK